MLMATCPGGHQGWSHSRKILAMLPGLSLASAAKIPGSEQNSWVDVCEYTDPVGVKCSCPPGARKEYLVVPENHDWHGHSLNCM